MALPDAQYTHLSFLGEGIPPINHLNINSLWDIPYDLDVIGLNPDAPTQFFDQDMAFFSSDHSILDPENPEDIQITYNPYIKRFLYSIFPKKNGRISLIAYPAEETDPHHLLSARINIDVSIDDTNYFQDRGKMAIIVAGYKGTGDSLWESTNYIANHAYKTLLAMGYTRQEIHYYNPYFLQDPDRNGIYDNIDGYPKPEIFDLDTNPNSPYAAFSKIHDPNTRKKELFLFLVDHRTEETFRLNPIRSLNADYFIDQIEAIAERVSDKIIFLYDACHSGSFLDKIEKRTYMDPNSPLSEKLITITSTDPNQIAYYLNHGIISFSYPFFDEWYLIHSLYQAFEYARDSLPQFGESTASLKGQEPRIFDLNTDRAWDLEHIYYTDEARPIIDHLRAYQRDGNLYLFANVFSLAGLERVWAVIESTQNILKSSHGKAITQATEFTLSLVSALNYPSQTNDPNSPSDPNFNYFGRYQLITPDPCPSEAVYTINIYSLDKSIMPKTASYKTGISDQKENKTRALIIATDLGLFSDQDERERFTSQLKRAKEILYGKIEPGHVVFSLNYQHLYEFSQRNIARRRVIIPGAPSVVLLEDQKYQSGSLDTISPARPFSSTQDSSLVSRVISGALQIVTGRISVSDTLKE